jgi:hypothetical protein
VLPFRQNRIISHRDRENKSESDVREISMKGSWFMAVPEDRPAGLRISWDEVNNDIEN